MALGGPYFSPFLLNVILSHACRHARPEDIRFNAYDSGEYFLRKAEQLLVEELRQERPRIPTIQGLLILGGRQCAVGKSSQGWLFTGMAVTMLKDLGLHLPRVMEALSRTMDPEDIEVRKRLFLSAYAWDKSISLTLGRQPSLVGLPYEPLQMLFDHSDDEEHWTPWYLGRENDYPLQRGYITSTFSHFFEHAQVRSQRNHYLKRNFLTYDDRLLKRYTLSCTVTGVENQMILPLLRSMHGFDSSTIDCLPIYVWTMFTHFRTAHHHISLL